MPPTLLTTHKVSLHGLIEQTKARTQDPGYNAEHGVLDLGWDDFHARVDRFLKAIDEYTLRAKKEIAARASDHTAAVRDLTANKDETERQIQLEQQRERDMLLTIEAERRTMTDLTSSLSRLNAALGRVREQGAALDNDISAVRKDSRAERATKDRQAKVLAEMRSQDERQLEVLEEALGLAVTGVGAHRLLLMFTLIDPAKPMREFSFVIDVSSQDYSVPQCDPPLASMSELVAQLNADRDLHTFIKKVRKAFVALVGPARNKLDDLSGPSRRPLAASLSASASVSSVPSRSVSASASWAASSRSQSREPNLIEI